MEIGVTGSGRLQRPDRLAGISEASNSIGGIGAVALIQLKKYPRQNANIQFLAITTIDYLKLQFYFMYVILLCTVIFTKI